MTSKILNVKTKDFKIVLKTEDLATKTEDQKFDLLTGKIWLLSMVN